MAWRFQPTRTIRCRATSRSHFTRTQSRRSTEALARVEAARLGEGNSPSSPVAFDLWVYFSHNPPLLVMSVSIFSQVACESRGDSSAAWQTASGEWRFLTRDYELSNVWSSDDFKTWTHIGAQPGFTQGACPSFFPLPKNTAGAASASASASAAASASASAAPAAAAAAGAGAVAVTEPNHVYMYSDTTVPGPNSHRTVMVVGDYVDKGKAALAGWT